MELFGINGSEFLVLLVVAAVVLGPERLPGYTKQLADLIRQLRRMAQQAGEQVRTELGPEFEEVDWRKLDPRQYDPRAILRQALTESLDDQDPLGLEELRRLTELDLKDTKLGLSEAAGMGLAAKAATAADDPLADWPAVGAESAGGLAALIADLAEPAGGAPVQARPANTAIFDPGTT